MKRKIVKGLLLCIMVASLLVSCNSSAKEKNVESFITKLVSSDTYQNIGNVEEAANFIEDCKTIFGDELTDEAFNSLIANRTFTIYSDVISGAKSVTDIEITKTSKTNNEGYIHMEYEVSYKLAYSDKTVDMKDYMAFSILDEKGYLVDKASVSGKTSSIYKEFKNIAP